MSTTPNMELTKPTEGGDPGTWDGELNDSLDLLDVHDHAPGKGVPVPTAGLGIDDDLTFAGFSAVDLRGLTFTQQASTTGIGNASLWVKDSDNTLYWKDTTGTDWKVADSTGLNVALVGGITGDYAASAASFYYDSAGKVYRALQSAPSPNVWASVAAGDVYFYEKLSGVANKVTMKSPATLAASYTLTLPAALPAATQLLQSSSAGALAFNVTGARCAMWATTLAASGLITSEAGVTASANQHITVSGSGEFKHGDRVLSLPPMAGQGDGITWIGSYSSWSGGAGSGNVTFAVPLRSGDRIKSIAAFVRDTTGGHAVSMVMWTSDNTGGASQVGATQTSAGDGTNQTLTLSGLTTTIASGHFYSVQVHSVDTTVTDHRSYGLEVTYDRP